MFESHSLARLITCEIFCEPVLGAICPHPASLRAPETNSGSNLLRSPTLAVVEAVACLAGNVRVAR